VQGGPTQAGSVSGPVVSVADGDTLTVRVGRHTEKIRLYGIDCPERHQAFGARARRATRELTDGGPVRAEVIGRDEYGRLLAEVFLADGRSLNRELVRRGLAWWYRRYSTDATLAALEAEARAARRGLWAEPHPVPPWEFRRRARAPREP
jgi:micrococcal nuclease